MTLPKIDGNRLQAIIFDLETFGGYGTYDELCQAIAKDSWAKKEGLTPNLIAHLIFEHQIICKTPMPDPFDLPKLEAETPKQVAPTVEVKGAGKGRKQCPECKTFVGVRTAECPCGYVFPKKGETPKVTASPPLVRIPIEKPIGEDEGLDFLTESSPKAPVTVPFDLESHEPKQIHHPIATAVPNGAYKDGPGRGRKLCPACKGYVAVRTETCPCGHIFKKGEKKDESLPPEPKHTSAGPESNFDFDLDETPRVNNAGRNLRIDTPAGNCPVALTAFDEASIFDWTERVRRAGVKDSRWFTRKALRYFARQFVDINGPQYPEVANIIDAVCCE